MKCQPQRASHDVRKRELKVKKAGLNYRKPSRNLVKLKQTEMWVRSPKKPIKIEERKLKPESVKTDLKEAQEEADRVK